MPARKSNLAAAGDTAKLLALTSRLVAAFWGLQGKLVQLGKESQGQARNEASRRGHK